MKNSLGIMIKQANNALSRDADHYAKTIGLTGMQISVINFIADHEQTQNIFQCDLEQEFNIRKATSSSLVTKMVKADLLVRVPTQHDARYKRLLLTPKARQLAAQIEQFFQKSEQRMAQLLTADKTRTYTALSAISKAFKTPTSISK